MLVVKVWTGCFAFLTSDSGIKTCTHVQCAKYQESFVQSKADNTDSKKKKNSIKIDRRPHKIFKVSKLLPHTFNYLIQRKEGLVTKGHSLCVTIF